MGDVVEQGQEPRGGGLPNAVRRAVVVLVLALVGFVLSRSGLLSADPPPQPDRTTGPVAEEGARLVARVDDHLVRLGQRDYSDGARLPPGLPSEAALVPVLAATGASTVLGVARAGLLFRVAPTRAARWSPIGRAAAVVAASTFPGRAYVLRGGAVVEVDVATGRVTNPAPFPGFPADGWFPEGVVSVTGTRPLLISRPSSDGAAVDLALAWPARRVEAGTNPPQQQLGTFDRLLGVADDWVLTTGGTCPGPGCRVRVVSVTRDEVLARDVAPPSGWSFVVGESAGRTRAALVPVQRTDDESVRGLARLVQGGENALLVRGTEGVDLDAGLADDLDGSVFLVTAGPAGRERVRVWRPERPGRAPPVERGPLPETARLVCVCG